MKVFEKYAVVETYTTRDVRLTTGTSVSIHYCDSEAHARRVANEKAEGADASYIKFIVVQIIAEVAKTATAWKEYQ